MNTLSNRAWTGILFAGFMSVGCSSPNMFSKSNNSLPPLPTKNALASKENNSTKAAQQLPANPASLPNMPGAQLTSTQNQAAPASSTGLSIPGNPPPVQPVNFNSTSNSSGLNNNAPMTPPTSNGIRMPDSLTRTSVPMPTPALTPMPAVPSLPQAVPPNMEMPLPSGPAPSMGMPPPSAGPTPITPPLPVAPPPPSSMPAIKARPTE